MHFARSILLLKRAPLKGISGTQPPPRAPSAAVAWGGARVCIQDRHQSHVTAAADIVQRVQSVRMHAASSPVRWETRLIALNP